MCRLASAFSLAHLYSDKIRSRLQIIPHPNFVLDKVDNEVGE